MKRPLEPDANPTRVNGRWMTGSLSHRHRLGETSAGGLAHSSPAAAESAASPGTLLAGDAATLAGRRPRLVIADDDPVVQSLLGASLGHEFEVVGMAADSEEAIELAQASQPDAALLDVVMPKGGGLRAVLGIVEAAPDTAIVVLSGCELDGVVGELIQAGAIAYRRKGVAPPVLAAALTEAIRIHTVERRESAWKILTWYCLGLDRRPRQRMRPDQA
jgi:CheY-like chemotaxis protein